MTELTLRPYQREAIDAVFQAWYDGMRRPAIVLPTGAGKTVVFSALVRQFRETQDPDPENTDAFRTGRRVMILAHRDELVDQAIAKLRAVMPGVNVGKVKADDRQVFADVVVCSVQTLARGKAIRQLHIAEHAQGPIGLIITDECHHAAAASYKKIYDAFPDALHLGVTATMARGDGVGLGKVWDDVVYKRSILWMISKGYLTDVRTKRVDLKALDLGAVKTSGSDWQAGDLGKALMDAEADTAIARAYKEHAGDRQGIVFTPTVETAEAASVALRKAGITTRCVDGKTPRIERQAVYEQYRQGRVQVLVNCMVLTEGFDMPQAEVAVIARPTQSAPLYTQMVGRVLRPYPGKKEALVLDLVGASANKLRTLIDLEPGSVTAMRDGETLAEAAVRESEEQNARVPAGSLAFELKAREVNAFGASDTAWIRTPAGVLFINCGDVKVYLAPNRDQLGLWDVKIAHKTHPGYQRWAWDETPYKGLDIGSAMAWGEAVSEDHYPGFGTSRNAAWRKRKPSERQLAYAARYGVEPAGLRAGELSDLIDRVLGARIFDRHVRG